MWQDIRDFARYLFHRRNSLYAGCLIIGLAERLDTNDKRQMAEYLDQLHKYDLKHNKS